jgi:hypothetical protein
MRNSKGFWLNRFAWFLISCCITCAAWAEEKTLTAKEIKQLLSGNTAVGYWIDHNYRQYFGADGSTIYAQENSRSSVGRWRTNSTRNHYESWWEQSDWGAGFSIVLKDDIYYWVSSTGTTEPQSFVVVPGQQLVFK